MFTKILSLILIAGIGLAWPAAETPAQEDSSQIDYQVKIVVSQFVKALLAKDFESMVNLTEVPFLWDGRGSIKNHEDLKTRFIGRFGKDSGQRMEYEIKDVHTVEKKQVEEAGNRSELLEVLKEGDRIVEVEVKSKQGGTRIIIMVSRRGGETKVIGYKD
ncbi:MAG TPA: hypothetical protein VLR90_01935 [Blastocatellia bacterium]|nr:hypothetical protein [Blastocatellia bacterium]